MKKFLDEFKTFALKGNMIDMSIGVIIGGAFSTVVGSLQGNIFNPLIGLLTGNVDLNDALKLTLVKEVLDETGKVVTPEVAVKFGAFISSLFNFLIMAFVVFLFVKALNKLRTLSDKLLKQKEKEAEAAPAAPTTKVCPYCKSEIAIDATRCPHCTSELE